MAINRSALRKDTAQAILKKIQEVTSKKEENLEEDNRFWKPTIDSNGNGFAIIRFLPAKTEDSLPFVKIYSHGFKVNSKWYIEECPTTINEKCPVCELNTKLWNSGYESDKKIVRERKRRLRYLSNILVIKDPKNPESEGKIFLFTYGQKIFDKLLSAMNPPEEYGEEPRDPFGFFEGCIVKLKIKNKDSFRNYDDTTVEPASDLYNGDEEKLMKVLENLYDLNEFVDPKRFKSYDELKRKLKQVLDEDEKEEKIDDEDVEMNSVGREYGVDKDKQIETKKKKQVINTQNDEDDEDEDDEDLKFFRSLVEEE